MITAAPGKTFQFMVKVILIRVHSQYSNEHYSQMICLELEISVHFEKHVLSQHLTIRDNATVTSLHNLVSNS